MSLTEEHLQTQTERTNTNLKKAHHNLYKDRVIITNIMLRDFVKRIASHDILYDKMDTETECIPTILH